MQNPAPSRKRAAPGASPAVQQPTNMQPQPTYQGYQQLLDNAGDLSSFDFSSPIPPEQASALEDNFSYNLNTSQPPTYGSNLAPAAPSTDLVRRTQMAEVVPGGQAGHLAGESWNGYGNVNASGQVEDEDEQDLDLKVRLAKQDAQGKRKQIPPFVQKLSSFLDSNNTDLIRWSDNGRAFIVLDEDEFARTLIPELFKHNNYASFVRQLNMYGFHKTVNITDGSLRQSEKARKGQKPPSMYSHPYFRRNRPDLLWLIQKPTSKSSAKRKRDGTMGKDQYGNIDSDGEEHGQYGSPAPPENGQGRQELLSSTAANNNNNTSQDLAPLPRNELAAVRQELRNLQTQQKFISQMITHLKDQNDQFYSQARNFQALHDRHENSINAILTFLATFYNRSMEGHGAQNLVNMFTNAAQHPGQSNQQHGSVVEEYNDGPPPEQQQVQRFVKRPPLLLPGPAPGPSVQNQHQNLQPPGSATTQPNSARASASPPGYGSKRSSIGSAASPAIKPDAQTPVNDPYQAPESNDQMMSLINTVNATTQASTPTASTPTLDMNSIVNQFGRNSGNAPLTPQQVDNVLAGMLPTDSRNGNGELQGQQGFDMGRLKQSHDQIDALQLLQRQNADKLENISRRLTPLSPTGTIPGLHHTTIAQPDPFESLSLNGGGSQGGAGEFDPNAFLDFDNEATNWDGTGENGGDFDFGFDTSGNANANGGSGDGFEGNWEFGDGANGDGDGDELFGENSGAGTMNDGLGLAPPETGRVESVSSEATSPANTVAEEDGPGGKRQRMQ